MGECGVRAGVQAESALRAPQDLMSAVRNANPERQQSNFSRQPIAAETLDDHRVVELHVP